MVWDQIEATPPHLSYLLISTFLITYVLFTNFLRNRLHLSEPPIALILGILLGPQVLQWLTPNFCDSKGCESEGPGGWGWGDGVVQELTRVIVGIQVFAVGVELPKYYASRHWRSVAMLLGPVMAFGWAVCATFAKYIFQIDWSTALIISACLTPTDPVLAASILSNSQFSTRVPKRLKDMLSAESGCNDGVSFPFLYIGLFFLTQNSVGDALKDWFLITVLWQCTFGVFIGLVIGISSNWMLRFSAARGFIDKSGFTVFYLLLAVFCVGVGSTLDSDDFLVAFGAGYGFARDGWFAKKTKEAQLPHIIDLLLNSSMFVYVGTILPFTSYNDTYLTPWITVPRLIGFLALVLLFRRIPIVLATYRFIPDIRTIREAVFCGHFGPMGLGALFLAIEGRAVLETGTSTPDNHPPQYAPPLTDRQKAIETIWPVVSFIVLGSTLVHGLSVLVLSLASHLRRHEKDRAGVPAAETDPLTHMVHSDGDGDSAEDTEDEHGQP
ncbi:Putative cation/H+ exchanger, sodium/solute symporter superfamily [Septoria linicola]|uniref:Cation/H+ exchanger, sodium/solute symporter superfamily n=1 Tax=Septoria linicola TaxID=215465 RepID=A0A9Q9ASH1_9PEZI|nr:putative cation/H+ exchanger, sodium/solute symporter superfamily [Septoria linicola]USW53829.1 Putative cation/H+ exchanger, sodium/solute symporter superfamily [Septoria linicola]